ncbi:MAG: hypothetical protein KKF48_00685 [Nanoarchaeota archaeon]|nr:hypothetical protein [Nanoarchaeota archaeon]MBU1027539.1 hypothetical protein [Nanoarchaeota archaeon]
MQRTIRRKLLPYFHPDRHPNAIQTATAIFQKLNNYSDIVESKFQKIKQITYQKPKQLEYKQTNLIEEIQKKEAELRKWITRYQNRINNPKKAPKLKNHVLRLEKELNQLKNQLNFKYR